MPVRSSGREISGRERTRNCDCRLASDGKDQEASAGPRAPTPPSYLEHKFISRAQDEGRSHMAVFFDPAESIRAAHACAPVYAERLLARRVLFVPSDGSAPLETVYQASNFMHLCGVSYNNISALTFWNLAISHRLPVAGLHANNRGVVAKREVLSTLVRIDEKATIMISNPELPGRTQADAVCASLPYAVGYRDSKSGMHPCTSLKLPDARMAGSRNIVMVLKTRPEEAVYSVISKKPARADSKKYDSKVANIRRSLRACEGECVFDMQLLQEAL